MQRMRQPAFHGAARRDHRLPDHLAAEHPLPAGLRAAPAEQVHLDRLEIEDGDQVDQAFGHGALSVLTHTSFTRSLRLRRVSKDGRMYHGPSFETPRKSAAPQDEDGGGVVALVW